MPPSLVVRQHFEMFETPVQDSCAFCDYLSGLKPCAFVTRSPRVSSFMNRAQYELGAVLVVPNSHLKTILDLDQQSMSDLYLEAQRLAFGMIKAFGAVGLNMFQNSGIQAGQTVPHLHLHLVPRYPNSDSRRIFREEDYPHAAMDELEERAAELRAVLSEDAA